MMTQGFVDPVDTHTQDSEGSPHDDHDDGMCKKPVSV